LKVISEERTSRFIYLSKCQDSMARNVERKAAEFLGRTRISSHLNSPLLSGVSSTTVEPIQVAS
jgi:hypothetical protein